MAEFVRRMDEVFVWGISMGNGSLVQEKKAAEISPWAISGGPCPRNGFCRAAPRVEVSEPLGLCLPSPGSPKPMTFPRCLASSSYVTSR